MVTYYLLCRKIEPSNQLDPSADIYTIEGRPYIGYCLDQKSERILEVLKNADLTAFRVVKLDFPNPKDLSSKAKFIFIRWVFICDS